MAPDDDLVAVGQRRPLDAAAVDVDAVERAVVEHAYAVGLGHDERVTARHRRVVEAHVGGQRAADARPLARHGHDDAAPGVLVGQVLARHRQVRARLLDPVGPRGARRLRGGGRRAAEPSPATGRVPVVSKSPGVRGSIYVSPLARVARAVPATLPPCGRLYGDGQWGRHLAGGGGFRARRRTPRSMPTPSRSCAVRSGDRPRPAVAARARAAAPQRRGAREARHAPLRALPPDAARRRARPRLRGAAGERLVCELCRPLRREAPARSELMHCAASRRARRSCRCAPAVGFAAPWTPSR